MTTTATTIIDRAAKLLYDASNVHWVRTDLFSWVNDGQREIVQLKPDVGATIVSQVLVAGTRQALPADGVALLDVRRNMGTNGSTPGAVPTFIEFDWFNRAKPNWHTDAAAAVVVHYLLDPRDRKRFYVYPQQPTAGFGYLELLYGKLPADLAAEGDNIGIGDENRNILIDYLLFRAFSMGMKGGNAAAAAAAYNRVLSALGLQEQGEQAHDPRNQPPAKRQVG